MKAKRMSCFGLLIAFILGLAPHVLAHNYTLSPREEAKVHIMQAAESYGLHNPMMLSYILGTAEWETGYFKHMKEIRGEKRPYAPYYGRGYVQLTHRTNYEKFSKILGVDLVNNPDLAVDKRHASTIIVHGMVHGVFTGALKKDGVHWSGKKLADYFDGKADWINARRIINGLDRAQEVANLAKKWFNYFKNARGKPNGDIKFLKWFAWHEDL